MKSLKKLGYLIPLVLPLILVFRFEQGGWHLYGTVIFAFIILPAIDYLIGLDTANVPKEEENSAAEEFYYRFVTYAWAFVQMGLVIWAAYVIGTGKINTTFEWIGFILSFGTITGGIGITVAHELGHKKSAWERFLAQVLLMTVSYMHFYIEHNRGHHVTVATPEDPATSRKDENFYSFWFRSVFMGYLHAWKIELESLRRKGKAAISIYNNMIWFALLPLVLCATLTLTSSWYHGYFVWQIIPFFFAQSVIAFTLLELVNYIEHYGIERREISPGKFERVNPLHSWNASHMISNFFLFQLQRHSDHHAYAHKRYQVLKHYDESPQLPFGYSTMILIALLPPLWFALMNKRLEHWKAMQYSTAALA
ncbi:MAG TPA: alkane 1-monooxygenase [Cyclobacteriaceae bacterium]|nr:alkane 1-monooxygenase [Cyclobacteriaceae bacterium]